MPTLTIQPPAKMCSRSVFQPVRRIGWRPVARDQPLQHDEGRAEADQEKQVLQRHPAMMTDRP
jgi:hypothetical protein